MDRLPGAVFANSLVYPIPDFHHASPAEVVAWAACLSLAAVLAGWWLVGRWPRGAVRRGLLLAAALGSFFAGCVISSRDHMQRAQERLASSREQQKSTPGGTGSPSEANP